MNELKKAAIILLSLDKPNAARVMNHLSKDLMELVSLEIARTDDVTQSEQQEAISQFNEAVDSRTVIERGSLDLAGELLSQSVGEEEANQIIKNIRDSLKSVPFGFLH
ncbi:MAG: magnesium and cobalt transport protein CorA, partial [Planctomycetales bacterium]